METPLLTILKNRFEKNMHRHQTLHWSDVEKKLKNSDKIEALGYMENTG
jgi:Protein of unknown function (DUF4256)